MKQSVQKVFMQSFLSKIKIGTTKRLIFVDIALPRGYDITPWLKLLQTIGVILHFNTRKTDHCRIWLRYKFISPNPSTVSVYLGRSPVVSVRHKNIKCENRAHPRGLNTMLLATPKGVLTNDQSLKHKVGGIYSIVTRTYKQATNFTRHKWTSESVNGRSGCNWSHTSYEGTQHKTYINLVSPLQPCSSINDRRPLQTFRPYGSENTINFFGISYSRIKLAKLQSRELTIKTVRLRGIGYKCEPVDQSWMNLNIDTNHLFVMTLSNIESACLSRKARLTKMKSIKRVNLTQFTEIVVRAKPPHKYATKREGVHMSHKRALRPRFKHRRYFRLLPAKKRKRRRRTTAPRRIKFLGQLNKDWNTIIA